MGCLDGIRVIELGGKGPVPFAGMVLADMGAEVFKCERLSGDNGLAGVDVLVRGKRVIRIDLKAGSAPSALLGALGGFDVVLEGFRPGAAARLGLGADDVLREHPKVVYGHMSGYGQGNSRSAVAGHDINFLAAGTALAHLGLNGQPPAIPLNLVGDFGGGGMILATGVLAALVERASSGRGQVVDAAITDGVAYLMASVYGMRAAGLWNPRRGTNLVDGGCPFYNVYATSDRQYVTVGALEPAQYAELLQVCELPGSLLATQFDRSSWPDLLERFAMVFRARTRAAWDHAFDGRDACYAPVVTIDEAWNDPFLRERETLIERDGVRQPAPAPRFSRTPSRCGPLAAERGDSRAALLAAGISAAMADELITAGAVS